jgi:hypothetical protein
VVGGHVSQGVAAGLMSPCAFGASSEVTPPLAGALLPPGVGCEEGLDVAMECYGFVVERLQGAKAPKCVSNGVFRGSMGRVQCGADQPGALESHVPGI